MMWIIRLSSEKSNTDLSLNLDIQALNLSLDIINPLVLLSLFQGGIPFLNLSKPFLDRNKMLFLSGFINCIAKLASNIRLVPLAGNLPVKKNVKLLINPLEKIPLLI